MTDVHIDLLADAARAVLPPGHHLQLALSRARASGGRADADYCLRLIVALPPDLQQAVALHYATAAGERFVRLALERAAGQA